MYYEMEMTLKLKPLYQKIIEIRRRTLGEDHPDYAASLNSLAIMYYEMGSTLKRVAISKDN